MTGANRLIAIDGTRGIAAIMVMLCHGTVYFERLVAHGHLAVDLFFMLSGFVLALVYERRFADGMDVKTYMTRRVFRLYPMLFLGALLGLIVFIIGPTEFEPTGAVDFSLAAISQLSLIPFLTSSTLAFPLNGTQWSISYELVANYLHLRIFEKLTMPVLVKIVVATGVITAGTALYHGDLDFGWQRERYLFGIVRACFGFFAGVLIYRLRPSFGTGFGSLGMPIIAALTIFVTMDPFAIGSNSTRAAIYELALLFTVLPMICIIATNVTGGAFTRALGTLSYPLYALHAPVVIAMRLSEVTLAFEIGVYIVLVMIAFVVGRWIDEPINLWRHKRDRQIKLRDGSVLASTNNPAPHLT